MSKICIHIGTHKTATTYIQALFQQNARLLARHGVIYPTLDTGAHHHALNGVWNKHFSEDPDATRAQWQGLVEKYAKTKKTVFISSEELSRLRPTATQANMAQMHALVSDFDEVMLLCSFRNQASFIQSIYQQVTRTRGGRPWKPFYKTALRARACDGLGLDYNRQFTRFLTGFDRRQIRLLSYDHEVQQAGGIVAAVLREIGCDLDPAKLRDVASEHANVSDQPLVNLITSHIAAPRVARPRLHELVADHIDTYFDSPARTTLFNRAELDQMADIFGPTNTALAARVAPFQPDFEVGPMLPRAVDVTRDMLDEGFWLALTRRLAREKKM